MRSVLISMRRSHAPSFGKFKPPLRVGAVPQPVSAAGAGAGASASAASTNATGTAVRNVVSVPEGMEDVCQHTTLEDQDDDGAPLDRTAVAKSGNAPAASAVTTSSPVASEPLTAVTNTLKTSVGPPPSKRMRPTAPFGAPLARVVAVSSTPPVVARYFKCMYRKSSRKVHKAWEGDGFLECRGAFVTIKDEEGKDVSKVLIG